MSKKTRIIEDALDGLQLACCKLPVAAIEDAGNSRLDQVDAAKAIILLLREAGIKGWPMGQLVCDLVRQGGDWAPKAAYDDKKRITKRHGGR